MQVKYSFELTKIELNQVNRVTNIYIYIILLSNIHLFY
jgi:hypothetical protein